MDDASINQEFSIVGDMITYYQWLFDVSTLLAKPSKHPRIRILMN